MSNTYKVVGKRPVGDMRPGELGELELTQEEETSHLAAGRIEIVPREYEVVGPHEVFGNPPGGKFSAALQVAQEWSLVEAGHIERVAKPTRKKADKG